MNNLKVKTIGMVVAMDKEIKPFLEKLNNEFKIEKVGGYEVFSYTIKDKKVYLVKSGIGEIYAAGATAILVSVYKCELILNFGVVGSLHSGVDVCETVIVKGVVHYDFDLSKIDNVKVGEYPNMQGAILNTDKGFLDFALSINDTLKPVICASADKFVADEDIKENLHKTFGADVCDMESAGVLLTSLNASVPTLIIKAVSDGKGGAEEFNKRVKTASTLYVDTVMKILELL